MGWFEVLSQGAGSRVAAGNTRLSVSGRTRILIAAILALVLVPIASTGATAAYSFANQQIADYARSFALGATGGQCKPWAAGVVNTVLSRNGLNARVGSGYYYAWKDAGGTLVALNDAQPGDVIQAIPKGYTYSSNPPTTVNGKVRLHTAIVVARTATQGQYLVRDSNWTNPNKVGEHYWTPAQWSAESDIFVWRFGAVGSAAFHYRAFVADFNKDGYGDIGIRDANNGVFYMRYGPSFTQEIATQWVGGSHYQPFAADFNKDGYGDIGMRDPNNGVFYMRYGPSFTQEIATQWVAG